MTSINPAECDRTTVYTGECRNFADTEWIRFDSGRRRSPDARDGNTWLIDVAHGSFWMSDDKVRNLVPLVPAPTGGQWTRDDLPKIGTPNPAHDSVVDGVLDTVVHWLNKHHPKPYPEDATPRVVWRERALEAERYLVDARRERDAAVARAETLDQARIEATRIVGSLCEQMATACRERDEWKARAERSEKAAEANKTGLGIAFARIGELKAKPAVAVTRADIEKAVKGKLVGSNITLPDDLFELQIDAVCDLFGVESAVDPVEAKARVEADRRYSGDPNHAFIEGAVWAARHVLGQEASSDE